MMCKTCKKKVTSSDSPRLCGTACSIYTPGHTVNQPGNCDHWDNGQCSLSNLDDNKKACAICKTNPKVYRNPMAPVWALKGLTKSCSLPCAVWSGCPNYTGPSGFPEKVGPTDPCPRK